MDFLRTEIEIFISVITFCLFGVHGKGCTHVEVTVFPWVPGIDLKASGSVVDFSHRAIWPAHWP